MAATSYRYLVNLPSVCQGKTIVEGTRIGVHDVVGDLFAHLFGHQGINLGCDDLREVPARSMMCPRRSRICCGTGNHYDAN